MNPSTDAEWFAIQARVSGEKIAETSLAQLGFETLLPLVARKVGGWRARKNPTKAGVGMPRKFVNRRDGGLIMRNFSRGRQEAPG